jgi:hypothetical protein
MKEVIEVWSGFKWPREGANGRLLYTQHAKLELHKSRDFPDNLKVTSNFSSTSM